MLLLLIILLQAQAANPPWGFWAHKRINKMALFTLPQELFAFYKPHLDYIEEHAVDPDKRRYAVVDEAPRHYIDIDHYGEYPFPELPRKWKDAVAKYSEDSLQAYGIVPWYIELMMYRLEDAMRNKEVKNILRLSAEIGHYIGDVHVPLHCTENYNGQLTNQNGIHGFWESRIPELIGDDYDYLVGKATYIPYINDRLWEVVLESHLMSDTVLQYEALLNEQFPASQKYAYETRGQSTVRTYSTAYALAYNDMLNNMVERRMRTTIIALGSFWYTAWINAGKPDLTGLDFQPYTDEELEEMNAIDNAWKSGGEMKGRQE
ncbi:MAG: S1/P1 Nuclease [Sphingobacteriales bacterium BACL12 MAG-120813-bin55]|nr:MAG: S1/P1 Nuclease [Sphingobacteriales bacterium BACL12 MAG-120813-bin55]